jgi:hypothetical protein
MVCRNLPQHVPLLTHGPRALQVLAAFEHGFTVRVNGMPQNIILVAIAPGRESRAPATNLGAGNRANPTSVENHHMSLRVTDPGSSTLSNVGNSRVELRSSLGSSVGQGSNPGIPNNGRMPRKAGLVQGSWTARAVQERARVGGEMVGAAFDMGAELRDIFSVEADGGVREGFVEIQI